MHSRVVFNVRSRQLRPRSCDMNTMHAFSKTYCRDAIHRVRTACRHSLHTAVLDRCLTLGSACYDKSVAVVLLHHRLRPRRGRILLTPDERSVIWGGECTRIPLSRRGYRQPRSTTLAAAKRCRYSRRKNPAITAFFSQTP